MVNIIRTRRASSGGSPRAAEVGEIDTKAPFQSVRAAVSLFGEPSSPKAKPPFIKKSKSQTEGVLDKEAQFHLALNELNKFKEQLRGAESTKAETLAELDKAKRTLDELKGKLQSVNESKKSILEATEALKSRVKELEEAKSNKTHDVPFDSGTHVNADNQKEEYKAAIAELDATKQQLSNMRRDFNTALEAKMAALQNAEEAQLAENAHRDRVTDLSKQIATMQEALAEIKASSKQAVEEHEKLVGKKEAELQSRRLAKQELEKKLIALKREYEPLLSENLDPQLSETNNQIESLQQQVQKFRASFLEAETSSRLELETAKQTLKQVEEEKKSLQISVESLKQELERVSEELSQHRYEEEQAGNLVQRLQDELREKKKELEAMHANKKSAAHASVGTLSSLERLALETERSKQEAEEMKQKTEELKEEAKLAKDMAIDEESKLSSLLKEIEEAKSADRAAQQEIEDISERANVAAPPSSNLPNNVSKIKLSKEEYKSLIEKVNESEKSAQGKVVATMAQVEALIASRKEAAIKIEAGLKEIKELKIAEDDALKSAEMAKAAATALEAELQKRHHQQQFN